MRKIDHVRKTIYIIVGILTIISLVFSLYKKISHAASSDESPIEHNGLPYLIGPGIGYYDSIDRSFVLNCVDDAIQRAGSVASDHTIIGVPYNGHFAVMFLKTDPLNIDGSGSNFVLNYVVSYDYIINGGFNTFVNNASFTIQVYNVLETIDNHTFYKSSNAHYPVYLRNPEYFVNMSGTQIFADSDSEVPVIPDGHSKGGVLANYIDSDDLLENNSDVPKVDTTPPSDPSNNSGWFQKILNGIGKLNQSIQGGVLTIGDYIGQIGDSIGQKIDEFRQDFGNLVGGIGEKIDNIFSWLSEDFDKNEFQSGLNSIPLISDLNGLHTLVNNSGMFNWSDVTAAQTVSFTFDFGGAVLPHSSTTIDFSWYTGTIKNICVALICTFLVLGLLVTIINQLPSIIGGHSGDKGGGSDS